MEKKAVLKTIGTFVIGAVGGILLMMSDDAYDAVSGALGNSTSNSLAVAQQQSLVATQVALKGVAQQQQAQVQQFSQDADAMKKKSSPSDSSRSSSRPTAVKQMRKRKRRKRSSRTSSNKCNSRCKSK